MLTIIKMSDDDAEILTLSGILGYHQRGELEEILDQLVDSSRIIIDLSQLEILKPEGIMTLLKYARMTDLRFVSPQKEQVKQLLETTGFSQVFNFFDTLEEARQLD